MASSGMLRRVALVRADVSEELSAFIIRVTRIGRLETALAVTSQRASVASYGYVPSSPILVILMMEALSSSETSVLTRATRPNISEDTILHSIFLIERKFLGHSHEKYVYKKIVLKWLASSVPLRKYRVKISFIPQPFPSRPLSIHSLVQHTSFSFYITSISIL
jgi:hypothetical protein